ncbi:hypothetical protein GE09DRAFT_1216599 [Coniochaeta sp. 2T2.1]|nr:hypothetical protein GE09DRAFT_1216599 [Coniochaeta sp. 2T2.1]
MSARRPSAAAAPGLMRANTVSSRWQAHNIYEEEDRSRSDSRRSDSRRDLSSHLYRSMAGSRRSSRTSLSESDADTDITTSTQDEKHLHSKHVPPAAPPPPRVPKPSKSRKDVIYEEDAPVERRDRRPRLRREETWMEEEEPRIPRSKSRRREEPLYREETEREIEEPRSRPRREVVYDDDSDPEPLPRPKRGEVIYEEDCDTPPKYNPFIDGPTTPPRGPSRAPSRAPSVMHEKHRTSGKEYKDYRSRTVVDEPPSRSRSRHRTSNRLTGRYYETEVAYHDSRPTSTRKARTTVGSSSQSGQSSAPRRSTSFLGNFFGPAIQAHHYDRPMKMVECVVCMEDDIPSHKTAKLKCGHRMCNSCLKYAFKLSVRDPQHMPPKCCTTDHIPLKHVERLFDTGFKKTWNRKYAEFSTRNRIYCPSRRCGEWIKPENIHRDADGRKYAKCGRCHTKVCYTCNGKWHGIRDCPRDEETHRFLEQAKQAGWQRCHRCKAVVELKEGCNHMTCRCGAEFCMICGSKWKTCDCPWFSHDAVESDRLEHMNIPMHIRSEPLSMRSDLLFDPPLPSPRDFRPGTIPPGTPARTRPQSYEDEALLRRVQEQRDERLARRMRALGHYEDDYDEDDDYQGRIGEIHGIGHSAGHHMNDDYRRRPETLIVPPAPHTEPRGQQQPTYDRTMPGGGTDYVSGVHRARGVPRASSMERRLADRFNSDLRNGPPRTQGPLPPPPPPMLKTAATMPIMPMPMPPPPPPQMMHMGGHHSSPGITPVRRRHTMEEELYPTRSMPAQQPRAPSGRTRVHRRTDDFDDDEEEVIPPPPVQTSGSRRSGRRNKASRQHRREPEEEPKGSRLAGLTGIGTGMHRVSEWVNYVEDVPPEEEGRVMGG